MARDPAPSAPPDNRPSTALPAEATTVVAGQDAAELALATSRALYQRSPVVILVADGDEPALVEATATAVKMGVPLLLTPASASGEASAAPGDQGGAVRAEIVRLAAKSVIALGDQARRWNSGAASAAPAPVGLIETPDVKPAAPLSQLLVLALDQAVSRAARATARATGARVVALADPDPRINDRAIDSLKGQAIEHVLGLGVAFGPPDRLRQRVNSAATGVKLPGGGQVVFPGRRMVALYGHPGDTQLGSLGEQGVQAAVTRAKQVAATYDGLGSEPVVPAFEIIATVASGSAGADGDYSSESSIAHLKPWVDAAKAQGVYVVLDLQPGRTDFLSQAKRYTELLAEPNVGLALDPEWRLKPGQVHMKQIGSVSAAEINETSAWLAGFTRERKLPQKVLLLHQFRLDMITERSTLDTSHDELRVVIHADGFGTPGQKLDTWNALHQNQPANLVWGWKNFYDEDQPTFTPARTVAVAPSPAFISYQ